MILLINSVGKNTVGEELGLEKGDGISGFDGNDATDILDYVYYDAQPHFSLQIVAKNGEKVSVDVEKDEDETLGLTFANDGLELMTCKNSCIFCFLKQMPKGLRKSLYVKDDDYRQSFLSGNFVTLTNLSDSDVERIIRLKLSPLYVSVHTINGELRKKMVGNANADKISELLKKFESAGIMINAQTVLVPGVNDGAELDYTLNELYKLNNIVSAAVVPCGITKYRNGLYTIKDADKEYSEQIIKQVENINNAHGARLIQLADEFYFKAGVKLPPACDYGAFPQVENGVGMSVKFLSDVDALIKSNTLLLESGRYLTVCGTSVYNFMKEICAKIQNVSKGVNIELVAVENDFFGKTVNCTGLLTGGDIYRAVCNRSDEYDVLLIPNPCLKQDEDVFLDGMTLEELALKTGKKVIRAVML